MSERRIEPLRLSGGPTQLSAAVRLPELDPRSRSVAVELRGASGHLVVKPVRGADPSVSVVKLRLPRNTPPGTYEGTVLVGDREVPVVANVEPQPDLRFLSTGLVARAGPAAKVDADVTVANVGNITINIEAKHTFCLFDGSGIHPALFAVLTEEKPAGEERINRLLDKIADLHGGLVRLVVKEGAGDIAPGEVRELRVALRFPERLQAGRSYSGAWSVSTGSYSVQIEVTEASNPKEETK